MHDDSPHPHPTAGGLRLVRRNPLVTGDISWMELFVDLFFVFAFLKVTTLMAADLTVVGMLRGVLVILLLWHCWTSCVWLGNVVHLDRGGMPPMMVGIAAVVLMIGVAVPETFVDLPGRLPGPVVVAVGYLAIRVSVLVVLTRSRWSEGPAGRRPAAISWATLAASASVLLTAALLPPHLPPRFDGDLVRLILFALALAIDFVILTAVGRGTWQIVSPWHLAERHALIVLIALGETIISIGTGGRVGVDIPVTWPLLTAATLGLVVVTALWWSYFDLAKILAEHALSRRSGVDQTRMARDVYSGLHLPMIGGLIFFALGLKHAIATMTGGTEHPWTVADAVILFGGVLLYLLALVAFEWLSGRLLGRSPILGIALLLGLLPVAARVPPLGSLALLSVGVVAMLVADRTVFRSRHSQLHRLTESESSRLHGVTPRELFLDLVFVFAFIQVTTLMTRQTSVLGIVRGLTLLALLWWAWTSYSWLTNAVRTDTVLVRITTIGIAASIMVIGIATPQAFEPAAGSLPGSLIIVACYLAGQLMQTVLILHASRTEPVLRELAQQNAVPSTAALVLLAGFAVVELVTTDRLAGIPAVTLLWVSALAIQLVGSYPTGVDSWRPRSIRHWVDRYALIMLIAFGEAIISVGLAVADQPISTTVMIIVGTAAVAVGALWWPYFTTIDSARLALEAQTGVDRARLARDGFTYLHLPMVACVILIAYGLHQAAVPPDETGIRFGHYAFYWGVGFYLLANQVYWWRTWRALSWYRIVSASVVIVLAYPTASLPAVWTLPALTVFGLISAAAEFRLVGDLRTRSPQPSRTRSPQPTPTPTRSPQPSRRPGDPRTR
ncbi:low temperature requirement protein A [Solwaraspora sp. WMMD406]|uniref:low temperature requirement protein A n=1 Tax=Solwaraspora sp. WMMD406 TaxID=3016095 RepID=UPI0024172F2E|nr:low temperature requirement protein A [Solwaraspora sp. WMMD406]MDG4767178.1 low temperature requirement protein A [Solwaraspora sp. WMMD406]